MSLESHTRLESRSPPPWQRQSYPPPPPTTTTTTSSQPPSLPQETLKSDTPAHHIPAPAYIDLAAVKPEKDTLDPRSQQTASLASTPAPSLPSSANMHLGPPPPYSSTHPTPSVTALAPAPSSQPVQLSQEVSPMPRRDSHEDKTQDFSRQSLPSISEALKLPSIYPHQSQQQSSALPPPPPPSFSQAAGLNDGSLSSVASGSPHIPKSYPDSHQPSSLSSFTSQPSPRSAKPSDSVGAHYYANGITESPRTSQRQLYSSQTSSPTDAQPPRGSPRLTAAVVGSHSHYPTSTPVPPPSATYVPRRSYPPTTQSGQAIQGLHSPHHSTYRPQYPPGGGYSFPPPQTSGLSYQESLAAGAAQHAWPARAEIEKVEEQRRAAAALHTKRGSIHGGYGLTVKRHLDDFDLENSLNEVAERTQHVLEFSRTYGSEAHKYPRSALPVSQLPAADKVVDMINQSIAITDALRRLQSTVEGMNMAAAAEEQARQQQQVAAGKIGAYPPYGADIAGHPGFGLHQGSNNTAEKGDTTPGGGFAGGDSKKRRGRNAPPGRCHSCNRAETPEWRRGPDGARTLCNACGLHYAKLTRKMGVKAGQPSGSNLRPKDGEDAGS